MEESYEYKLNLNLLYLNIPLSAKVSLDLGGTKIHGLFGPYLGMGLSGKIKYEVTYDGETGKDENDIKFGSDKYKHQYKRLDFGIITGTGVEIKSIQVGLSYGLGLANISLWSDNMGEIISNRVLRLSVGYKFGGK